MQKILGTGLTGLLGSRIIQILPQFEFISISRTSGVDITDPSSLENALSGFDGKFVLHMAAKTDVDGCEQDRNMGEDGDAWKINVEGTQNIAKICKKYDKKIIYISTDFVFDGEKPFGEFYVQRDTPNPINWYGETKYEGEKRVVESGVENIIMRIAYPYGISKAPKKDFVRIIAARLLEGKPVAGVTDHVMCPTFIDDIANALDVVVGNDASGLFHVVGNTPISPYEAVLKIAEKIGVDRSVIGKTTRAEYFKDKALRPFNLYLKNDKINSSSIETRSFDEGIDLMNLTEVF